MVVTCPECGTQYSFPEERLKPGGVKVRCSRCRHVFHLTLPGAEAKSEEKPPIRPFSQPPLDQEGPTPVTATPEGPPQTGPETETLTPQEEGVSPQPRPEVGSRLNFRARKWFGLGLMILVLLIAGVGGLAWWQTRGSPHSPLAYLKKLVPSRKTAPDLPSAPKSEGTGSAPEVVNVPPIPVPAPDLKELPITWARARYRGLINVKGGQLLVIQGEVANQGKSPRGPIRVKAVLTDAQHRPLREEVAYTGSTFSDQELKSLTPEEIREWLSKPGGRSQMRVITPGQTQPFTVVFFGAPDNLAESRSGFQILVVEGPKTASSP